ncbi:hypothetical protein K504DRAFT_508926 [Pleomassaria siparia CBS 279.74]|uniref:Uncharacterized protein n=1 Tax=Pleomassaria siparia CBS 279.74 TaxID=1314801 RepID=A0A6G1JPK2_9PLEO|nr:hypothetical protein K504DRAFT_508926 [Pleomassaria siparia CBS 279.74]
MVAQSTLAQKGAFQRQLARLACLRTTHIADFEGREGDKEAVYSKEEETDQDKDKEDKEAVYFLTSASYLHCTTGEDIYGIEPAIQAD